MQTPSPDQHNHAHCLVLCTCPDAQSAESIAQALLEARLAACANIVPGLTSIYRWEGKIEKSSELLLIIKTRAALWHELETAIKSNHPYELPEIISIPIHKGLTNYLAWIDENVVSSELI